MALKFSVLTRANMRQLKPGQSLHEHGIIFDRMDDGDGRFRVNLMVDGRRVHRVVGMESDGVTREKVEEFIEKVKTEAREDRLKLPKGRKTALTFKEAGEKYIEKLKEEGGKNISIKERQLEQHLDPFFGAIPLAGLSTSDLERYKKQRLEQKAAPATINRELAVISHLFSKAVEWKWIDHRPAKINRIKENNARITYLTREQIDRLLEAAGGDRNPQIYLFIKIGLETSMRKSEILSIRLEHIDLDRQVVYLPKAKAGAREQPITKHLAEILKEQLELAEPEQEWLFPSGKSEKGHTDNIDKAFRRVVARAGMDPKEVVRHTLRHTAITHLVQAGVDLPTVQRISGHRTLIMVSRYAHQNGAHIQAALEKLEARYRTPSSGPEKKTTTPTEVGEDNTPAITPVVESGTSGTAGQGVTSGESPTTAFVRAELNEAAAQRPEPRRRGRPRKYPLPAGPTQTGHPERAAGSRATSPTARGTQPVTVIRKRRPSAGSTDPTPTAPTPGDKRRPEKE